MLIDRCAPFAADSGNTLCHCQAKGHHRAVGYSALSVVQSRNVRRVCGPNRNECMRLVVVRNKLPCGVQQVHTEQYGVLDIGLFLKKFRATFDPLLNLKLI